MDDEPALQEVDVLESEGGGDFEAGLNFEELAEEFDVFAFKCGGGMGLRLLEKLLLAVEVELSVSDQAVEERAEATFFEAGEDGVVEVIDNGEEELVVFVEGASARSEIAGPEGVRSGESSVRRGLEALDHGVTP